MAKKKQASVSQKSLSPEQYIHRKARTLPIGDCYITDDWQKAGEGMIIVTRCHAKGTYTLGMYLVDTFCRGVKDSNYLFSIDEVDYKDYIQHLQETTGGHLKKITYEEVHNLIYGAVAFAEEGGIEPSASFALTQYILEEDDEKIPLIEYEFGKEGKHFLCANDRLELSKYASRLQKAVGTDFWFLLPEMDAPAAGSKYVDPSFLATLNALQQKMQDMPKIEEETYSYVHPEYPTSLSVKNEWLVEMLYDPENSCYLSETQRTKILAIPHDELRYDLEQILLYEVGRTYKEIPEERWDEEWASPVIHCIVLLGQVGNEASLSVVLQTLCQNEEFHEFHFGDIKEDVYIPTLYLLGKNHLDKLMDYMQTPGLYTYARLCVPAALAAWGIEEPKHREEVIEWFRKLLVFYEGKLEERICCDGTLIGLMTSNLLDLQAVELLPELQKLYDTGLVDEGCCGDFEEVRSEMYRRPIASERWSTDLNEIYAKLKQWQ